MGWDRNGLADDIIYGLEHFIAMLELFGMEAIAGSASRRLLRPLILAEQYADFAERERVEGLG